MSKIMFRAPLGPPIDGVPQEAVLTEDEVDAICETIEYSPSIFEELRKYSELVNEIRADPDPNSFVGLPLCIAEVRNVVEKSTHRQNANKLSVDVIYEFMRRNGWIE